MVSLGGGADLMRPDFLSDDFPPAVNKGDTAREARSPMAQFGWLFAVALIGFAATSAAVWFGPGAMEYLREVASRSSDRAPTSQPGTASPSNPFWVSQNPVIIQPPPIRQFSFPQGNGFPARSPGRGASFSGFRFPR
jgi:hypothetical protein